MPKLTVIQIKLFFNRTNTSKFDMAQQNINFNQLLTKGL
jgi:hypothetical protein